MRTRMGLYRWAIALSLVGIVQWIHIPPSVQAAGVETNTNTALEITKIFRGARGVI